MINEQEFRYVECCCTAAEHILRFRIDELYEDLPTLYLEVQLNPNVKFFKRVWLAIKYIFGWKSRYGNWLEAEFIGNDVEKLIEVCNEYMDIYDKHSKTEKK